MSVKWNGGQISARITAEVTTAVRDAADDVLEKAVSSILEGGKTGKIYRRRGVTHQASASGEAPASDTGRLAQSGRTFFKETSESVVAGVNFSTAYAGALEFGTQTIEPRPYARPALAEVRKDLKQTVATAVSKATQ